MTTEGLKSNGKESFILDGEALHLMNQGIKAGWRAYEHGNRMDYYGNPVQGPKRWNGQPTGHLLITGEQGYGDMIQFMRFLPLAAERCEKLSVMLPRTLRQLARDSFKRADIEICEELPLHYDHYCLIMSLAHLLDRLDDLPAPPYLVASDQYRGVRAIPGLKVGLVWQGRKTNQGERWRSIPFETFKQVLDAPAHFVSLQFPCETDLTPYPIAIIPPPVDWATTAAVIDALDLVISVDTAVAHLAGALGKPVWLLYWHTVNWRWLMKDGQVAWYPSMTIYQQTTLDAWEPVLTAVQEDLAMLAMSPEFSLRSSEP